VVSSGPVARAAAEYFAGLLCSLTSRGQGQVRSSQAPYTWPAANGVLTCGHTLSFRVLFAEWILVTLLIQCHVALRT
jgi:hypothetical protein